MDIIRIKNVGFSSNCYLLTSGNEAALIDPSSAADEISLTIDKYGFSLRYIILTHAHFDHMLSLAEVRKTYGAPLCMGKGDVGALSDPTVSLFSALRKDYTFDPPEIVLNDGDELSLGEEKIRIIETPGHTPGSICLSVDDILVTGDTLFDMSVGRCDLPGGNEDTLYDSLCRITGEYPDAVIYSGHGNVTDMKTQIAYNPFLKRL